RRPDRHYGRRSQDWQPGQPRRRASRNILARDEYPRTESEETAGHSRWTVAPGKPATDVAKIDTRKDQSDDTDRKQRPQPARRPSAGPKEHYAEEHLDK